jgi:hypothetical protein
MSNSSDDFLLKRVLAHFEHIAAKMVEVAGESLSTDHPPIDYYDSDFYLAKMEEAFGDVEENRLRKIVFENIDKINAIFFKCSEASRNKEK